ncbi:hypothetical protein ACFLU6_11665, partial [Acidobacteriota bacterium]
MKRFKPVRLLSSTLFILAALLPAGPLAGQTASAPVFTQWIDSEGSQMTAHEPLAFSRPLQIWEASRLQPAKQLPQEAGSSRICIIVHQNIYQAVYAGLDQYERDLAAQGFSVLTLEYASGSPEEIRSYLMGRYEEPESLSGAVVIGEIPYILYEMMCDYGMGDQYDDFPCDLFYMDLDGIWSDSLDQGQVRANNGKYDTRSGNLEAEIWVSRMKTANLNSLGSEDTILNGYFSKNHRYRVGDMVPAKKALSYIDDDWALMAPEDTANLADLYGDGNVVTVSDPEQTTAPDYISNHLPAAYELMLLRSHGTPENHGFYQNNKMWMDFVFSNDYRTTKPMALFYSLFVCSGADYTAANNLAGTVAFNLDDSGLLAWGSTKTGGMWGDEHFYNALIEGEVFGEAFRLPISEE